MAQFFNVLNGTLAGCIPQALLTGSESRVAVQRLQRFLLQEERPRLSRACRAEEDRKVLGGVGVILVNASARWRPQSPAVIKDVTAHVKPGSLCAIIGPVGAGKSSLLHIILGELPLCSGCMEVEDQVSYASQEPWLFVGSVRQNILFGQPYVKKKYDKVVRVCALQRDMELFPYGDKTIVGERGVSLSGGQRARINLARAVYRSADLYLLDDPLSAVDTQVGKQLFEQCIKGYLVGKTRILVTHQLQHLKDADIIIILNDNLSTLGILVPDQTKLK